MAAGGTDIYVKMEASEGDIAGGIALDRDSDVVVADVAGMEVPMPLKGLVAANPAAHAEFMKAIA